jgi:hypothetical protein
MLLWMIPAFGGQPAPSWCVDREGLVEPLHEALAVGWPEATTTVRVGGQTCGGAGELWWDGQRVAWLDDAHLLEADTPDALDAVLLARTWSVSDTPPDPGQRYLPAPPAQQTEPPPQLPQDEPGERARPGLRFGVGARTWLGRPRPVDGVRLVTAWEPARPRGVAMEACLSWMPSRGVGAPADPELVAALAERDAEQRWDDRATAGVGWVVRPVAGERAALRLGLGPELSWSDLRLQDGGMAWVPSSALRLGATATAGAWVSVGRVELVGQGISRISGLTDLTWDLGAEVDVRYLLR